MSKFKQFVSKTWVLGAAGAMILGGGAVTATALSQSAFADTVNSTVYGTSTSAPQVSSPAPASTANGTSASAPQVSSSAPASNANGTSASAPQVPSSAPASTAGGYTLMNLMDDSQTPGPQDLSVQQAAADAASALNQKYGLDLTGYEFFPGFFKGAAPNTDIWAFKINTPPNTVPWTYVVTMNAVTGQIIVVNK